MSLEGFSWCSYLLHDSDDKDSSSILIFFPACQMAYQLISMWLLLSLISIPTGILSRNLASLYRVTLNVGMGNGKWIQKNDCSLSCRTEQTEMCYKVLVKKEWTVHGRNKQTGWSGFGPTTSQTLTHEQWQIQTFRKGGSATGAQSAPENFGVATPTSST